ncbi:hypothetical protein TNCV_2237481 [Trichonephila clavipes]|nr:hypothetical protein TNCV_2237481 [Trichonephila clavipes]
MEEVRKILYLLPVSFEAMYCVKGSLMVVESYLQQSEIQKVKVSFEFYLVVEQHLHSAPPGKIQFTLNSDDVFPLQLETSNL